MDPQVFVGEDDALGNHIAAGEPAEDVHEYGLHSWILENDAERGFDALAGGFAPGVEEVGTAAAAGVESVDGVHCQTSAVDY